MAQDFALDLVEGELLIRDTPAPLALTNPTSISGSHDTGEGGTGVISNGAFDTPSVPFETTAFGLNVHVVASFSEASPGTGSIDDEGNVTFNASVNVNLDIKVGDTIPPAVHADCNAGPVNLTLESTVPWDPSTNIVTVADPDFTIPGVPITPDCIETVANGVNDKLAGAGHSLSMTLAGPLELPTPAACKTLTTLGIAPPGGEVRLGDQVTFTATVAQDPTFATDEACDDVESGDLPGGLVEYRAGNTLLGTAPLDGTGTATFTTTDIQAGTFPMTARYRGEAPWGKSTSPAQTFKVAARPLVTADFPTNIVIENGYVEVEATITNNTLGSAVTNARLDMSVLTVNPDGAGVNPLLATQLEVEYWDGASWVPVTEVAGHPIIAPVSPNTGFPLPAGGEVTRKFHLRVPPGIASSVTPRYLDISLNVIAVDPGTGLPAPEEAAAPVGSMTARVLLTSTTRRQLTLLSPSLVPHTLRQGQTARLNFFLSDPLDASRPGGTITVLLDGKPVNIRENATAPELGLLPSLPSGSANNAEFPIPDDALTGQRTVTLKYSGNAFYEPLEWTTTLYVFPSRGTTYACKASVLSTDLIYVNMTARADLGLGARPSGGTLNLAQLEVAMSMDRGDATQVGGFVGAFNILEHPVSPAGTVFGFTPQSIEFGFDGPGTGTSTVAGAGTATHTTIANFTAMNDSTLPVDPNPDMVFGFKGESAALTVTGTPGDVIPIELNTVKISGGLWPGGGDPFSFNMDCKPVTAPITIGEVTVAGTTLTVDAPDPTRAGDFVTLNAKVAPAGIPGTVELRDGTNALTVVPVRSDGTATLTTDTLAVGTHTLSAKFYGGLTAVTTTSAPVTLAVLPETDCAAFAEEGNGAVVRLVYIELLERCPDQTGYDHWVDRLDDGTTPEAFARTISRTTEAVGLVVDDAYETMLGRAPDAGGRTFRIGRLQASGRYDQLLADLAGSAEFWSLSGSSNTGFVTRVYERLLNRAPDPSGLDHWVGRLDTGTSRQVLVRDFANRDEPLGHLVAAAYEETLSRTPTNAERTDGIDHLRQTGNRSGLYAQLIGTPEFDDRAQDFPNPED